MLYRAAVDDSAAACGRYACAGGGGFEIGIAAARENPNRHGGRVPPGEEDYCEGCRDGRDKIIIYST